MAAFTRLLDTRRAAGQSRPSRRYAEAPQGLLVGRWGHVLREYIPLVRLGLGVDQSDWAVATVFCAPFLKRFVELGNGHALSAL